MQRSVLAERDHAVTPAAELLRLGVRRPDGLVLEECRHEVPEERSAMRRAPSELHPCDAMAHTYVVSFSRCTRRRSSSSREGKFSSFMPSERFISCRNSLIS